MPRVKITDPALTVPGQAILNALDRYSYLTIRQLCELLGYSRESRLVQKTVRSLANAGYVFTGNSEPRAERRDGASASVICLTVRGKRALDGDTERNVPAHNYTKSAAYLSHLLPLNDTLIAFERFAETTDGFHLAHFLHDTDLKRLQLPTVPDGYVAIGYGEDVTGFMIELDRGTERFSDAHQSTTWQKKIEGLVTFASGPYREVFPYEALQTAIVIRDRTGSNEQRLRNLLTWTEHILTSNPAWGEFFRFTTADPTTMSPAEFISGAHWVTPFTLQELPLVEL